MTDPLFFESLREAARGHRSPVSPPGSSSSRVNVGEDPFKSSVTISLVAHASLVVFLVVAPLIAALFGIRLDYSDKFKAKEFKNAIRVDVVDLPSLTMQELQKVDPTLDVGIPKEDKPAAPAETPAAPPPSETATKLPEKVDDSANAAKKKEEAAKKKADSAQKKRLADLRASLRVEERRKQLEAELKKGEGEGRAPLAGNIASQGYSTSGDVADDMDVFQGKLKAHIHRNWSLPGWMTASNLSVRVLLKIGPTGKILSHAFIKRSGNEEYDRYVNQALEDAQPYPNPPPDLQRKLMEQGFELGFPQ